MIILWFIKFFFHFPTFFFQSRKLLGKLKNDLIQVPTRTILLPESSLLQKFLATFTQKSVLYIYLKNNTSLAIQLIIIPYIFNIVTIYSYTFFPKSHYSFFIPSLKYFSIISLWFKTLLRIYNTYYKIINAKKVIHVLKFQN